jgi:uncharacterized glyoxalase superfamily protein PhnB
MTDADARTVASSVEVSVDPDTAFRVFTEELDCWWLQGPINFFDSTRAYGKRMEPGVGGRLLEVYDPASGEGLEVGRLTSWEPGVRLAWTSSVDDVSTVVTFRKVDGGTVVRVEATVPAGAADHGGSAWVRVVPAWLPRWTAVRDQVPHEPAVPSRLAVAVHYRDPLGGARWLRDVAGLAPAGPVPEALDDDHGVWIEFRVGDAVVAVVGDGPAGGGTPSHTPWVFVDDLDDHYARVVRAGGLVVEAPWHHGARAYGVEDPEGHRWTFVQASPRMLAVGD